MRRWWIKVGGKWLLVYGLLYCFEFFYMAVCHEPVFSGDPPYSPLLTLAIILRYSLWFARGVVFVVLWLCAANIAIKELDKAIAEKLLPASAHKPVMLFLLALAQCGWLLLLSAGLNSIGALVNNWVIWRTVPDSSVDFAAINTIPSQINGFFKTIGINFQWLGWLAGILAVTYRRPIVIWLWIGLTYLLPSLISHVSSICVNFDWISNQLSSAQRAPTTYPLIWLAGIIFALMMIDGFRARRWWLAYGIFTIMLISSLIGSCWNLLPLNNAGSGTITILGDISDWIAGISFAPASFLPSYSIAGSDLGRLGFTLRPFETWVDIPDFLQPLQSLINLAWVMLTFGVMILFALREPAWDKTASQ